MSATHESPETVSFHRRSELPGVEVRTLRNSDRPWRRFATEFEFLAPSSWQAQVWHRRREAVIAPGFVLCAQPGEVFAAERVLVRGSANSLMVDRKVLREYVAEHELPPERLRLRAVARMSNDLLSRLFELFTVVRPGPTAMEIQAGMVEFVAALVSELLDETGTPSSKPTHDSRAAERIRQCLHADPSVTIDLTTLAKQTGMSRFRVLRVFKRRFGLPPHTYQLQLRLGLAQKSLREGLHPAQVAAEYGFVDQSHLTRHFKRLLGVTPAQYARVAAQKGPNEPLSVPELEGSNAVAP
jgi:AraC-like DNA-binding protein